MARNQRAFKRVDRVNKQLLEQISSLLLFDVSDPRIKEIQVTAVDTSPDLSFARVFYIFVDPESQTSKDDIQVALEGVVGFVRRQLSDRVHMRRLPELRFVYDDAVENGRHIESLLSNITYSDQDVDE